MIAKGIWGTSKYPICHKLTFKINLTAIVLVHLLNHFVKAVIAWTNDDFRIEIENQMKAETEYKVYLASIPTIEKSSESSSLLIVPPPSLSTRENISRISSRSFSWGEVHRPLRTAELIGVEIFLWNSQLSNCFTGSKNEWRKTIAVSSLAFSSKRWPHINFSN